MKEIIHGDCLEVMKGMADKFVDLVLTDPPYGIDFGSEKNSMSNGLRIDGTRRIYNEWSNPTPKNYVKWDDTKPTKEFFDEIFRISKHQIIWGGNYFTEFLPPSGGWLIWDKGVVMPTLSKCELAWTSFLGHTEIKHYLWAGFRKESPEERYHTTQKPLEVIKWCLSLKEDAETILDPFAGSCTTLIACKQLNRRCICIEKEEDYVKIGRERLSGMTKSMF